MLIVMITRQIELDEECDRILSRLAREYGGDIDQALGEIIRAYGSLESLAELSEAAQGEALTIQRDRAERGFREGRFTSWHEVKRTREELRRGTLLHERVQPPQRRLQPLQFREHPSE